MKGGRLKGIGTRTVKLRGRAKAVTFHSFDPWHIEESLDCDLQALWRDEARAKSRRLSATSVLLGRAAKGNEKAARKPGNAGGRPPRGGWEAFDAEGLLR